MDSGILNFLRALFSSNAAATAGIAAFALIFLLLGAALGSGFAWIKMKSRIKAERADAAKRSRAVVGGQAAERLSPWLAGFPADPTEVRFLGTPVDFAAFAGLSQGNVSEVVFIEVKTGSSRLSPAEESLKAAVEAGRVRYEIYRPPL